MVTLLLKRFLIMFFIILVLVFALGASIGLVRTIDLAFADQLEPVQPNLVSDVPSPPEEVVPQRIAQTIPQIRPLQQEPPEKCARIIKNEAQIGASNAQPVSDTASTFLCTPPMLEISKVSSTGTNTQSGEPYAIPGQIIVYTLTYSNVGELTANGVVITDTVPLSTTFVGPDSWSCPSGSIAGTICTLSVDVLPGGTSMSTTFVVTVTLSELPPTPEPVSDLITVDIENITVTCPDGSGTCETEVIFVVANMGTGDAGPFNVQVALDPSQDIIVNQPVDDGLGAGESQTFSITTPPGGNCFDPDCTVCVTVDSDLDITESNEENNQLCETRGG